MRLEHNVRDLSPTRESAYTAEHFTFDERCSVLHGSAVYFDVKHSTCNLYRPRMRCEVRAGYLLPPRPYFTESHRAMERALL